MSGPTEYTLRVVYRIVTDSIVTTNGHSTGQPPGASGLTNQLALVNGQTIVFDMNAQPDPADTATVASIRNQIAIASLYKMFYELDLARVVGDIATN